MDYAQRIYGALRQLGAGTSSRLEIIKITVKPGQGTFMALKEAGKTQPGFLEHWVVKWNGRIIDTLTGPTGQPVKDWVKRWMYVDDVKTFNKLFQCEYFAP
jgi:hypothetical protein